MRSFTDFLALEDRVGVVRQPGQELISGLLWLHTRLHPVEAEAEVHRRRFAHSRPGIKTAPTGPWPKGISAWVFNSFRTGNDLP